ncbi:hypothetical protein D3C78_1380790 [compost metagenome]
MRQLAFDVFTRANKILRIIVVLFNAGRDGENIRIENNVFGWEADLFGQNLVGASANLNFALAGIRLTDLVKGHHHDGRAITAHKFGVVDKRLNPLFHRDGVNDAFTLNALQPFFDDVPF